MVDEDHVAMDPEVSRPDDASALRSGDVSPGDRCKVQPHVRLLVDLLAGVVHVRA